ncbi:MAG: hypothetical protein HY231_23565 [Acidobacteria bacterium]|nr:hypothetical protein [Acidobacteriota bacterium]
MSEINWPGLLHGEDVEGLWSGLYQIIARHPAVRPLHFATDGAADASPVEINADLTQELFLELFQKQRFDYYLESGYSSTEIENEIAHIEVPNLVGARLRKRYPESFRMARRVSALLKTSSLFCLVEETANAGTAPTNKRRGRPAKAVKSTAPTVAGFTLADEEDDHEALDDLDDDLLPIKPNGHTTGRHKRMVNRVYGLKRWRNSKPVGDSGHFVELIQSVPTRKRDTRIVGRSGASQLILSNPELEELMVEIFTAIDSPADVRTLRQLVLSKIPLQDYNIASLDEELKSGSNGSTLRRDPADTRDTAEDSLLRREQHQLAADLASDFLHRLRRSVNHNERRYARLLATLWHCFYNPANPSQLEIADLLGVSDSLVSDNRRLIEFELKKLNLSVEDGAIFSESLKILVTPTTSIH